MKTYSEKSFIYFLVDADETLARFKIGHSVNPYLRQKTLRQEFDLDRSWQVECNAKEARELEQQMHKDYADCRIHAHEIGKTAGNTEWFHLKCLDELLQGVRDPAHAEYLGVPMKISKGFKTVTLRVPVDIHLKMHVAALAKGGNMHKDLLSLLEAHYK